MVPVELFGGMMPGMVPVELFGGMMPGIGLGIGPGNPPVGPLSDGATGGAPGGPIGWGTNGTASCGIPTRSPKGKPCSPPMYSFWSKQHGKKVPHPICCPALPVGCVL